MREKILLVGEHPRGYSGNSHMMQALLDQVDQEKYNVSVFAATEGPPAIDVYQDYPFNVFESGRDSSFGAHKLLNVLLMSKPSIVIFVGIDIWRYAPIWADLKRMRQQAGFLWSAIFPYDNDFIRTDWIDWIKDLNMPCVYSQAGFELLSNAGVSHIQYFRPNLYKNEVFVPYSRDQKLELRRNMFPNLPDDTFVFGWVGNNQFRKDPLRAIKAYFEISADYPNTALYLHTTLHSEDSVYNIPQYIKDLESRYGTRMILAKNQSRFYFPEEMAKIFNIIDCLVNTSLQEGLSWTLLEAMLCKVAVIGAYNTAQKELLGGGGICVRSNEPAYVPSMSSSGPAFIEATACNYNDLKQAMRDILGTPGYEREVIGEFGYNVAKEWLKGVNNVNDLIRHCLKLKENTRNIVYFKENRILFAQHSSAGDVFMTTKCFKGLLERHPDCKLDYMTMPQFKNIIEGNPYVNEVLDWDEAKMQEYRFVYNPHGDRILPGHWGRNSNSLLSDFYWKILQVEKSDFFIQLKETAALPNIDKPIAVVHTTGGDPHFRTYKYMGKVCRFLEDKGYVTIQLGGFKDFPAGASIDLRGRLTYQETAWVVSKAEMAVTVDSFMSHLCGAFGVNQVCLFGSGNHNVVKPDQVGGRLICMTPDYINICPGLGPCSASKRDCPAPCTGSHDPDKIIDHLTILHEDMKIKERLFKMLSQIEEEVKQSKGE